MSPHHGNDTKGAEVVAPVVYFDEAARVEGVKGGMVVEKVAVVSFGVAVTGSKMLVDNVK